MKKNGDRTVHFPDKDGAFQPVDLCSPPMAQKLPPTDGLCPLQMLFGFAINDNYACCAQRIVVDQMAKCRVSACVIATWLVMLIYVFRASVFPIQCFDSSLVI